MKILSYLKTVILIPALTLAVSCDNTDNDFDNDGVLTDENVHVEEEDTYQQDRENRDKDSRKFVADAASTGMMEVQLAELAQTKAQNTEVKQLAQTIQADHQKANQELKSLTTEKNWTLPDQMNDNHRDEVEDLKDESAENFDREFLQAMIESHRNAIDMYEKQAENLANYDEKHGDRDRSNNMDNTNNATETASGNNSQTNNTSANTSGNNTTTTTTGNNTGTNNTSANNTNTGEKMELRQWINQQLPILRDHLKRSEELEKKLQNDNQS